MFVLHVPWRDIAIRTAVVYLVILLGLRLAGKREVGQLTVIDLVALLLISNAVCVGASVSRSHRVASATG